MIANEGVVGESCGDGCACGWIVKVWWSFSSMELEGECEYTEGDPVRGEAGAISSGKDVVRRSMGGL